MGYFKRKARLLIRWVMDDSENVVEEPSKMYYKHGTGINTIAGSQHNNVGDGVNGMNFTVYSATGGKVVQVRTYKPHADVGRTTLYVITDKDDLGEELGMIITRESLSQ